MRQSFLLALCLTSPAMAQVEPVPGSENPRVQVINFVAGQPVRLPIAPSGALTVVLGPGEYVQTATIDDPSSYQVTVAAAADGFFVRSLRVGRTKLHVATDQRQYEFDLLTMDAANIPYLVYVAREMKAPAPISPPSPSAHVPGPGAYKLSGNKELRPASIRDDGARTFLQWEHDQAIPAVFSLDRLGREEMVNGYMRDGLFTIDRVHDRLVFRIDRAIARATRLKEKVGA